MILKNSEGESVSTSVGHLVSQFLVGQSVNQ